MQIWVVKEGSLKESVLQPKEQLEINQVGGRTYMPKGPKKKHGSFRELQISEGLECGM